MFAEQADGLNVRRQALLRLSMDLKSPWFGSQTSIAGAQARLFCFPYAGGTEAAYRTWQQHVRHTIQIVPVQLPGRGSRVAEQAFTRLGPLVLALSQCFASEIDRPFAFFGHSMGGLIAFELARQLRRGRRPLPVHLFISAKCCPRHTEVVPAPDLSDLQLIEVLRQYEGTPAEVLDNGELMNILLPAIRADMEMCNTYLCDSEPPLDCPITVFGGLNDLVSTRSCLEGWRDYTTGPFTIRMFPGGHFFIQKWEGSVLDVICRELAGR